MRAVARGAREQHGGDSWGRETCGAPHRATAAASGGGASSMGWGKRLLVQQHLQTVLSASMGLVYVASLGALVGGVARVYRCVHPASARRRRHGGSWIRLLLRVLALGSCVSASTYTGAFSAVIAGQANSCFLQQDGTMKCWGANTNGQLNVPSGQFVEVAAGNNGGCGSQGAYVCGLRASGTAVNHTHKALCWGEAGCGVTTVPSAVLSHLTTSNAFVCGLTVAGSIQCWGRNDVSQLSAPTGTNFVQVAAGVVKSCALTTSGSLSCWGDPGTPLTPPGGTTFIAFCVGWSHACGIKSDVSVGCFGSNALGQLNSPSGVFVQLDCKWDFTCAVTPLNTTVCWDANATLQCNVPPRLLSMRMVSTGRWHACGVLTTGGIVCWGVPQPGDAANDFGQASVPPGAVAIAVCAAGSAGSGNGTCSSCRDGTFSLTAASTCLPCTCSPGYASTSVASSRCSGANGTCHVCSGGFSFAGGAKQPVPCLGRVVEFGPGHGVHTCHQLAVGEVVWISFLVCAGVAAFTRVHMVSGSVTSRHESPHRSSGSRQRGFSTRRMTCLFVLANIGVHRALAALPAGCTAVAGTLTSCATYAGGATLPLQSQGLTAVQSGAFGGLSSVTTL